MKTIIRAIYKWRYGVRGALKPPLNPTRGKRTLFYRWRWAMWQIEEAVYAWTGLPDEWWVWMRKI